MNVKHKVLKDFQFITNDKKIIILKAKTILENYKYITKFESVLIEKDIIDNNPEFFSKIEWTEELNTYLKLNKIPQPAIVTKKLIPFIEEMIRVIEPKSNNDEIYRKEIELESRSKELDEREGKLNKYNIDISIRESELSKLKNEIDSKTKELSEMKISIDLKVKELESNKIDTQEYFHKSKLHEITDDLKKSGFDTSLLDDVIRRI